MRINIKSSTFMSFVILVGLIALTNSLHQAKSSPQTLTNNQSFKVDITSPIETDLTQNIQTQITHNFQIRPNRLLQQQNDASDNKWQSKTIKKVQIVQDESEDQQKAQITNLDSDDWNPKKNKNNKRKVTSDEQEISQKTTLPLKQSELPQLNQNNKQALSDNNFKDEKPTITNDEHLTNDKTIPNTQQSTQNSQAPSITNTEQPIEDKVWTSIKKLEAQNQQAEIEQRKQKLKSQLIRAKEELKDSPKDQAVKSQVEKPTQTANQEKTPDETIINDDEEKAQSTATVDKNQLKPVQNQSDKTSEKQEVLKPTDEADANPVNIQQSQKNSKVSEQSSIQDLQDNRNQESNNQHSNLVGEQTYKSSQLQTSVGKNQQTENDKNLDASNPASYNSIKAPTQQSIEEIERVIQEQKGTNKEIQSISQPSVNGDNTAQTINLQQQQKGFSPQSETQSSDAKPITSNDKLTQSIEQIVQSKQAPQPSNNPLSSSQTKAQSTKDKTDKTDQNHIIDQNDSIDETDATDGAGISDTQFVSDKDKGQIQADKGQIQADKAQEIDSAGLGQQTDPSLFDGKETKQIQTHFVVSTNSETPQQTQNKMNDNKSQQNIFDSLPIYEPSQLSPKDYKNQPQQNESTPSQQSSQGQNSFSNKNFDSNENFSNNISSLVQRLSTMEQLIQSITTAKPKPNQTQQPNQQNQISYQPNNNEKLQISNLEQRLDSMDSKVTQLEEKIKTDSVNNPLSKDQQPQSSKQSTLTQEIQNRVSRLEVDVHDIQQKQVMRSQEEEQFVANKQMEQLKQSLETLRKTVNILGKSIQQLNLEKQQHSKTSLQSHQKINEKINQQHAKLYPETQQNNKQTDASIAIQHNNQQQTANIPELTGVQQEVNAKANTPQVTAKKDTQTQINNKNYQQSDDQSHKKSTNGQIQGQNQGQRQKQGQGQGSKIKETPSASQKEIQQNKNESKAPLINHQAKDTQSQQDEQSQKQDQSQQQSIIDSKKTKIIPTNQKKIFDFSQEEEQQENTNRNIRKYPAKSTKQNSSLIFGFSLGQLIFYLAIGTSSLFLCNKLFFNKQPKPTVFATNNTKFSGNNNLNDNVDNNPHNRSIEKFKSNQPPYIENDEELISERRMNRQVQSQTVEEIQQIGRKNQKNGILTHNYQSKQLTENVFPGSSGSDMKKPVSDELVNLSGLNQAESVFESSQSFSLNNKVKVDGVTHQQRATTSQHQQSNRLIRPLKKPTNKLTLQHFQKVSIPNGFDVLIGANSKAYESQASLANKNKLQQEVLNVADTVSLYPSEEVKQARLDQEEQFEEYSDGTHKMASQNDIDTLAISSNQHVQNQTIITSGHEPIMQHFIEPAIVQHPVSTQQNVQPDVSEPRKLSKQEDQFEDFQEPQLNQQSQQYSKQEPAQTPKDQKEEKFIEGQVVLIGSNQDQPEIVEQQVLSTVNTGENNLPNNNLVTNGELNTNSQDKNEQKDADPFGNLM